MKLEINIFSSELEFRKYVIQNSQNIFRLIIFEDILDSTIFFYCFFQKGFICATKEPSNKKFISFRKFYTELATELNLRIVPVFRRTPTVEFINNHSC